MAGEVGKWGSSLKHSWVLIPLVANGVIVVVVALAYSFISSNINDDAATAMDASLAHVAAGVQPLIDANRSAAVVAHSLQIPSNESSYFQYVGPYMVMALAMQPQVAEISYTSVDGAALTYYRGESGQPRAKFGIRLVLNEWRGASELRRMGVAMVCVVCAVVAVATLVCCLMARALWRAGAREAALEADLVRQKEALQQAERKSMNKSNAFARASHDIRSSLAAIVGLVEVSRPEAGSNTNLTYNLEQMEVGTNKLFDILNTILDMGKVESGKMQLEEVEFRMADVLEESMDLANVVGMSRGVEVIWDPCDFSVLRCTPTMGDCKRIKQILDNLLGNAIKFTHEGHVMVRAWANRPIMRSSVVSTPSRFTPRRRTGGIFRRLLGRRENRSEQNSRMSLQNDPNSVEFYFEVVDTGVGIPEEKRESVFENYVQVKEGQGGTGLGLGIVQSFVRLMGGEISIKEKEPGEAGTCFGFNIFLKVSEPPEVEEDLEQGRTPPSAFREPACFKGGHCVLLAHGDETRRILHTWMESVGMKVWPVTRAEFLAPTLEKARSAPGASPLRSASTSSLHGVGSGDFNSGTTDRCFSSKEMVTHLRNSSGMAGSHGGHLHLFGLLVIVDVSGGRLDEVALEAPTLARIKQQAPCRVVCLTDLKTPSEDMRRFKEAASVDLELRKPIHGSRLHKLLQVMRDLQANPFTQQQPYQLGAAMKELPAADETSELAEASEITPVAEPSEITPSVEASEIMPAAAAPAPQLGPANAGEGKPLEGMRVLLVEDTVLLQRIQKQMLTNLGATVELATDGSVAVAMFTKALEDANGVSESHVDTVAMPYDVILMDCQMPVMNGYEATRRIREEESRYGIRTPIIALTANSAEEGLQDAMEAGMDLHLTKPIPKPRIAQIVLDLCNQVQN
ncbi:probable histidine kinase 2 [Hordeum vulgare subsp. vulgare]|uniref:probable histidine kinase 2 n=1 Tax=Hordeum vulgare subsp. vulgare TaxID=112509 RepID=UPI001D1A38A0|nr:probable histidine kinase 2 [Hordeum vulgare subsp. vulgare]